MDKRALESDPMWINKHLAKKKSLVPDFSNHPAEVQMNTAAILKEEVLVQKQLAEEARIMKELEVNMRDSTEFKRW